MPFDITSAPHVISVKLEPKSMLFEEELRSALGKLVRADARLSFTVDPESGETVLYGDSELQLDSAVGQLLSAGITVNVGHPQIAYYEVLARPADIDYTHKTRTGGTGQFARVKLKLEPNETGKGNVFETSIVGCAIPKEYIAGVEKGVKSVWDNGVLIGFPLVDMKVNLYDGAFHEVDSSALAFEIAARAAMKEGCEKGGVKILEPIMDVEVVTPGEFVGSVIGDINSRRGQIRTQEMRGNATVIRAYVPFAHMFGYMSQLRSISTGRASHLVTFNHYAPVSKNIAPDPDTFPPAIGV